MTSTTAATAGDASRRAGPAGSGPVTIVAMVLGAVLVLAAVFAPLVAPYAPNAGNVTDRLEGFGVHGHLLGTDGEGRDMLSRLIYGARLSLLTGFIPVLVSGFIGSSLGILAGLGQPRVHGAIMRTLDVFYAFPAVLLAIAIAAALGSGISNSIIALSVILIPPVARVAETETAPDPHRSISSTRPGPAGPAGPASRCARSCPTWLRRSSSTAPP